MLRDLGVKPNKALPSPLVEGASSHDDIILVGDLASLAAANTPHASAIDALPPPDPAAD